MELQKIVRENEPTLSDVINNFKDKFFSDILSAV